MHTKSETGISPHDISALNVWIFSLKNTAKLMLTLWPKGKLLRTSVEVCTCYKLFERQFMKVAREYTYEDSTALSLS